MAEPRAQSLRIELLVTLALLVGLAVMSLSLVSQALAKSRHDAREVERLDIYARGMASLASNHFHGPNDFDRATVIDLLQQSVSTQLGVRSIGLYLVSPRGASLVASVGGELPDAPPAAGHEGLDEAHSSRGDFLVIDALVPTFGGQRDAPLPVLRVAATPKSWIQEGVILQLVLVSLAITGLVLLAGNFLLDGKILAPMRSLSEATQRIARGDLRTPIPEDGPTEFQSLARDFNGMVGSLDAERLANVRQAAALRRSEQLAAVGKLAAGVAHEVGNPLAAVHGYLEFLLDPREGMSDAHAEILRTMATQTERIRDIVAQLLDYSRPRDLIEADCELRGELARVVDLVRMDPRADGVSLTVSTGEPVTIVTDVAFLSQILINLLLNASAAAREGEASGQVLASVAMDARGGATITVSDDGRGVPVELFDQIFEPFFTTRLAGEGTGLGLAMTRGLAERLGGQVRCLPPDYAGRPGALPGACFELRLPGRPPAAEDMDGGPVAPENASNAATTPGTPDAPTTTPAPESTSDARL